DQLNSELPPSQQPIQHEGISYVNKTDYSNKHIRTCQTTKHHYKLPMKISYRISSNMPSTTNNTEINQGTNISIDLRSSSIPYKNSQTKRISSQYATTDNINNSTNRSFQRINSRRRQTSNLIENSAELTRSYSNQCKHCQITVCDTCICNNIKCLVENTINPNIVCP
ncbi:unnamed protein product, partial [Rotaria sp. Silwood2]